MVFIANQCFLGFQNFGTPKKLQNNKNLRLENAAQLRTSKDESAHSKKLKGELTNAKIKRILEDFFYTKQCTKPRKLFKVHPTH